MRPQDRIRRDRLNVMPRVKEGATRKMRKRVDGARKRRTGAVDEIERSVDSDVESLFIDECSKLARRYRFRAAKCDECDGRRKCGACSGAGGKDGIFSFRSCRTCKGTGICRGCLRSAQAVLDTMAKAEKFATMRGVAGGESPEQFRALLDTLDASMEEAMVLQAILNAALRGSR